MKKSIKNIRDGFHVNSKYWQNWKKSIKGFSESEKQLFIGIILSDATIYRVSKEARMKFEQGKDQKDFLYHLFNKVKLYCFIVEPGIRFKNNTIKSYWFKTFSHQSFSELYDKFYVNAKKTIQYSTIIDLNEEGFSYWVMGDGRLHRDKRVLTLHTQSFTFHENIILRKQINSIFKMHSQVKKHKDKYVIQFPTKDANCLHDMLIKYTISEIKYKIPRKIVLLKI